MYQAGHIPGALSRPVSQDVVPEGQEEAGTFRDPEVLAREYEALGVTPDKEVLVYCGSGLESSELAYTLRHRLGYEKVRLYDGSWIEWSLTPGTPRESGSGAPPEAMEAARAAADALTRELKSHLVRELQQGGPARALRVCAEVAQSVAASRSSDRTYVRRVSLRYRNEADRPDPFEEGALRHMERLREEGQLPTEMSQVVAQEQGLVLRYMRPVMVASPCLTCHGEPEKIDPKVRALLEEHYPEDLATGYRAGDLRGAVSVTVRLD
jgi:rhodanese-related sulfurtransferase